MSYPAEVAANLDFFRANCLWHVVSENPPVTSCLDAAQRRKRLGRDGIPLCDELKTSLGKCSTRSERGYVAVHCRGHQQLDEGKLALALGSPFERLSQEELSSSFGAKKGLVNPFSLSLRSDVQQVFDESILKPYFPPHTMMTNLGHLRYGVEFRPSDVVERIENRLVTDIVKEEGRRGPTEHRLGILTGNSPESGILLWQWINSRIRASKVFRGDISFPSVFVESAPGMGLSMQLEQREVVVRPVVLDGIRRLCDSGATVVGIACNTTQYFAGEIEEVCGKYGTQFVKTADETARYLRRHNITTFDFLGIGPVSDFKKWSGYRAALAEFDVKIPSAKNVAEITELAYRVKDQVVTNSTINRLSGLINRATRTQHVVLALTELSVVFAGQRGRQLPEKTFVDTLVILADRMADIYIQEYLDVLKTSGPEE